MKRLILHRLNPVQRKKIKDLMALCGQAEDVRLSIPLPPAGTDLDGECFFVLYDHGNLVSAAHLFYPDQQIGELIGFTHPEYRKQGYFKQLLSLACDYAEESELHQVYLIGDGRSTDGTAAVCALGLEISYTEYMLFKELSVSENDSAIVPETNRNLSLAETNSPDLIGSLITSIFAYDQSQTEALLAEIQETPSIRSIVLYLDQTPVGQAQITRLDDVAYLSGFGVLPQFRRTGLGLQFLQQLEKRLIRQGISRLTLQVSSKNKPALLLYQKDGFEILENLHYFGLFDEL